MAKKNINNGALANNAVETQIQNMMDLFSQDRAYSNMQISFSGLLERKALTRLETAEQLGICTRKLDQLVSENEIRSFKIGRSRRFLMLDVIEYELMLVDKTMKKRSRPKSKSLKMPSAFDFVLRLAS